MTSEILISFAKPAELADAQRFYDDHGYRGDPIKVRDTVLLACRRGELVGIVRLCQEDGFLCLRGMRVHPDFRRLGLGTRMLEHLETVMANQPCYCLPYIYLAHFYGQVGFISIDPVQLPPLLERRANDYIQRDILVSAMYRPAGQRIHSRNGTGSVQGPTEQTGCGYGLEH